MPREENKLGQGAVDKPRRVKLIFPTDVRERGRAAGGACSELGLPQVSRRNCKNFSQICNSRSVWSSSPQRTILLLAAMTVCCQISSKHENLQVFIITGRKYVYCMESEVQDI